MSVTQSIENRKADWKKWSRWLLWWRIDPEELRRQVEDYATARWSFTARGFAALVALMLGVPKLSVGIVAFAVVTDRLWLLFVAELRTPSVASCLLAEGLLFLILGCFLYRGKRRAILGMMVFASIDLAISTIESYYYLPRHADIERAVFPVVFLLGWCCFMHVLYTALRVERERTRAA